MGKWLIALGLAALAGCASDGLSRLEERALYLQHAGPPVDRFQLFGQLNGWNPLDDHTLVVQTRPNEAYLLQTTGPCQDLDWAPAIAITSLGSQVQARFDRINVLGGGTNVMRVACRIETIRPLDTKAIRAQRAELRKAETSERPAEDAAPTAPDR
ncbi:DUF6491 family protein [Pseudoxanthomonas composti]|uniref:Lipoprotein n=1 Tax=Pseudoxanthomonas composti TaxID=2137479 RepID=A0A4Q1JYM7_9GAMM|nr:DUF6491 family protein [Pseudoxanthomonas composti]RXR08473.1 hypothetical protein EPA99_01205 [Pseudoxanthomonas composti]